MQKKTTLLLCVLAAICLMLAACGAQTAPETTAQTQPATTAAPETTTPETTAAPETESPETEPEVMEAPAAQEPETNEAVLEDGVYEAEFNTDSGMFHVNEAYGGKGILTVENGQMTIHISLVSKNIVNLYPGTAEDAQAEGAAILQPTTDEVDYGDGTTDEVYGFDVPVPYLDEEFDCAILGKKGTWYDHKVSVSNPVPVEVSEE